MDLVSSKNYEPMRLKDIAMLLQVPKAKRSELAEVMEILVKEGKIELRAACDGVLKINLDALYAVNSDDEICFATIHGNKPVSYTHLDVYKRQAHWLDCYCNCDSH